MIKNDESVVAMDELKIEIDIFSGEFQTLVKLVKEKKIPVRKISLSKISEMFNIYVGENRDNLKNIGEYMALASYLTYLKSKEILPRHNDENFNRERNTFYKIIEDYELLNSAKKIIEEDFGHGRKKYISLKHRKEIDDEKMEKQLSEFLEEFLYFNERLNIVREPFTVEDAMEILNEKNNFSVSDLYVYCGYNKLRFIVYFLAALTLIRNDIYFFENNIFYKK
ncbi:MAG TPA: hypothetical protein PLS66_08470 [Tepiditoga sp.]|nr:hypothetical protein [Tepiditoga sp.]